MRGPLVEIPKPDFDYDNDPRYYSYNPLPAGWIRLVRCVTGVWKGTSSISFTVEDLELQMVEMSIEECPPYDALSYVWGNPRIEDEEEASKQIFSTVQRIYPVRCDGQFVRVTKSLRDLLFLMFRFNFEDAQTIFKSNNGREKQTWFWADGVCINQDDIEERARCVAMMATIYSKASTVLTSLGREDGHTDAALRTNHIMASLDEKSLRHGDFFNQKVLSSIDGQTISEDDWCHWIMLFTRTWFSRTWIIQEAGLGGQDVVLMLGLKSTRLALLIMAYMKLIQLHWQCFLLELITKHQARYPIFEKLGSSLTDLISGGWAMPHLWTLWASKDKGTKPSFCDLSRPLFAGSVCQDPRDKVYAAMGVSSEFATATSSVPIDYTISVAELYARTSKFMLESNKNMDFLTLTSYQGAQVQMDGLPSWCPDYNKSSDHITSLWQHDDQTKLHWRAGGTSLSISHDRLTDWKLLRVRGCQIDRVQSTHQIIESKNASSLIHSFVQIIGMLRIALEVAQSQRQADLTVNAMGMLWRAIFRDMWEGRSPAGSEIGKLFAHYLCFELCRSMWADRNHIDRDIARLFDETVKALQKYDHHARSILDFSDFIQAEIMIYRLADLAKMNLSSDDNPEIDNYLKLARQNGEAGHMRRLQPYRHEDENVYPKIESHIQTALKRRAVFNTAKLRIGLGPNTIRSGDEIWLLAGAKTPFVFRPRDGNHVFLGEAYLYGAMHGEFWPEDDDVLASVSLE